MSADSTLEHTEHLAPAPDALAAKARGCPGCEGARSHLPKVAAMLAAAEDDILAFYAFATDHWRKLRGTNRWSASTARSAGAPTSSGSSPTTAR